MDEMLAEQRWAFLVLVAKLVKNSGRCPRAGPGCPKLSALCFAQWRGWSASPQLFPSVPSQAAGSASQMVREELGLPASHGGQPEQ